MASTTTTRGSGSTRSGTAGGPGPGSARLPAYKPPRATRTRERTRALLAGLTLLAVLVGVPGALVLALGSPIPTTVPTSDDLTGSISSTALLRILSLVVWLAWAHFVVCVLVEWRAERRGTGLPGRVPLGGGSQALARRLVAATLLLSGTSILLAPSSGHGHHNEAVAQSGRGGSAVTAPARPGDHPGVAAPNAAGSGEMVATGRGGGPFAGSADGQLAPNAGRARQPTKYYEVRPHAGRNYDTLWGIAERFLGDGMRYREVYALNHGRVQPDGRSLEKPDLIHPGWTLYLPADASGPGVMTLQAPAAPSSGGSTGAGTSSGVGSGGAATVEPVSQHGGATRQAGGDQRTGGGQAIAEAASPGGFGAERGLAGASLLAAGLLVALARRRSGRGDPAGGGETEAALRLAADEGAALFLDHSLRHLAAELTATGRSLPAVFAASLADDRIALFFAPAEAAPPPAPWITSDGGRFWFLDRVPETPDGLAAGTVIPEDAPAPYPGLATIGRDAHGARILVDVEGAPGVVSLGGDLPTARDIAVSLAVELATNVWSDELRVCLVGFSDDLTPIAPHRLRYAATLTQALDEVEERLSARRRGAGGGLGVVLRGRQVARMQAMFSPDLLILSAPPTAEEDRRLSALADGRDQAVGVVTVGDTPAARWRFAVRRDGHMSTGVLGIDVQAQTLPVGDYEAIVRLFAGLGDGAGSGSAPLASLAPVAGSAGTGRGSVVVPMPRADEGRGGFEFEPPSGPLRLVGGHEAGGQGAGGQPVSGQGAGGPRAGEAGGRPPGRRPETASSGPVPPVPARVPRAEPTRPLGPAPATGPPPVPAAAQAPAAQAPAAQSPTAQTPVGPAPAGPAARPMSTGTPPGNRPGGDGTTHPLGPSGMRRILPDLTVPAAVEVRVLGALSVDAPGPLDYDRADLLTEIVIYLALHQEGVHPGVLVSAIWPRGVSDDVVEATVGHLRAWLGTDEAGRSRLATGEDGRWRLSDEVRCDWDLFQAFAARGRYGSPAVDAIADLTTALRLVSGPLWADVPGGRYGWLARTQLEEISRVAVIGVAHDLAALALSESDLGTAVAAARTGLRAVPAAEQLWRDLLRIVASRGDRASLEAVASEMYRVISPAGSGRAPEAETDALVADLLPGFRRRSA